MVVIFAYSLALQFRVLGDFSLPNNPDKPHSLTHFLT
jgi:hypothetical protein